jgi:hypothetical protein
MSWRRARPRPSADRRKGRVGRRPRRLVARGDGQGLIRLPLRGHGLGGPSVHPLRKPTLCFRSLFEFRTCADLAQSLSSDLWIDWKA